MNRALCVFLLVSSTILVFGNDDDYDDYDEEEVQPSNSTANSTLVFTRHLENLTVDPGTKVVKLICEVQNLDTNNSKVTFAWRKNVAP